ncbi:hypothetical protein D3C87_1909670 [compost metagenome]
MLIGLRCQIGDLVCTLKGTRLVIPAQDELGNTSFGNTQMKMQEALDSAYTYLIENYAEQQYIWDTALIKKWGNGPASEKQRMLVQKRFKDYDVSELTKIEASQILNRVFYKI